MKKTLTQMVSEPADGCFDNADFDLAEDNPSNEYPEDEVSSGDEYGYNAYTHRKNASDEEEFDVDDDDDH